MSPDKAKNKELNALQSLQLYFLPYFHPIQGDTTCPIFPISPSARLGLHRGTHDAFTHAKPPGLVLGSRFLKLLQDLSFSRENVAGADSAGERFPAPQGGFAVFTGRSSTAKRHRGGERLPQPQPPPNLQVLEAFSHSHHKSVPKITFPRCLFPTSP